MKLNNLSKIAIVAIGGTGLIAGAAYLIHNIKKNKNTKDLNIESEKDSSEIDNNMDSSIKEMENESDDVIDTVCFDDMTSDDEETQARRNDNEVYQFIEYLIKNRRTVAEIEKITETIRLIESELPEEFIKVRTEMLELLDAEFDIEKIMKFDEKNYRMLYTSIDPCQLFIKNGFKILAMGPEYQENMMNLASALSDIKDDDKSSEIAEVMCDIYHTFNDINPDTMTSDVYLIKFKKYVDKYVKNDIEEN